MMFRVRAVLIGKVTPLGWRGIPSGIAKQPQHGAIRICRDGLLGDEQGDRKHHGGPEKAVHHYPFDHYATWREELPGSSCPADGAFGENISTLGMTEADVCIGDVFRLGTAIVQVSQGRQPCWKLNERFGEPGMARRVQETGRTGWYYRVLQEGDVAADDAILLVDRPAAGWTLQQVADVLYRDVLNLHRLAELARLPELSASWRSLASRRLEHRSVEDWSRRLATPEEAAQ
jgi:MOSC domain-containing protein YiiM